MGEEALTAGSALALAERLGHEEVVLLHDRTCGLRAVIAIHDTTLGPAVGGTRMRTYASFEDAVVDALRLSRAMTYKAAMAEVPWGGGKAVIVGDPARDKTRALLGAYASAVQRLGGRFTTGADMGIDGRDVAVMTRTTRHASHTPPGAGVDVGDLTALGLRAGLRAVAAEMDRPLGSLRVCIQGLGQIGYRLARLLAAEGCALLACDVDEARTARARDEIGLTPVDPGAAYDAEADVFSPNAAGGVLDAGTVARLRCGAVLGGANEQLATPEDGDALHARGILYAPDYVVNAGGLLSLLFETGRTDEAGVRRRVEGIGATLAALLQRARAEGRPAHRVADAVVEERLAAERARNTRPGRRPSPAS
jgi:leucine dehydrogenase